MGANEYKLIQICLNLKKMSGYFEFVTVYIGFFLEGTKKYSVSMRDDIEKLALGL